ncbi:hypothetical protein [Actinomadura sp. 9N215]|uniref:hypothetical protein n=1 Tax=Actinomadura sp. 9N215 TaxID=3375150 RepID=UPI0037A1BEF0
MTFTGGADLLAVWEWGLSQPEQGRALALHSAARPDADVQELLATPIGAREADLYALRRALFGERMQVVTECAACDEVVEFDLDATALGTPPATALGFTPESNSHPTEDTDSVASRGGALRVVEDGWVVEFRPPAVADLAAAAGGGDPSEARRSLVTRCTLSATQDGRPVDPDELPDHVRRRLAEAAERADPAAETTLRITCPECGESTLAELDIAAHLWAELDTWARDLLLDVHLLATAYGWTEPEILALSPLRRRYYLELCADA